MNEEEEQTNVLPGNFRQANIVTPKVDFFEGRMHVGVDPEFSPANVTSQAAKPQESKARRGLDTIFPDPNELKVLSYLIEKHVPKKDRVPYSETLHQYAEIEDPSAKKLSLESRLGAFEKSDVFKQSMLQTSVLKEYLNEKAAATRAEAHQSNQARVGSAESPTGLSVSEGDAASTFAGNAAKTADNVGGGLASGMAGLVHAFKSGNGKDPLQGIVQDVRNITKAGMEAVFGDTAKRQENSLVKKAELSDAKLGALVNGFMSLPSDSPKDVVEASLNNINKAAKQVTSDTRALAKNGVDNILDNTLTDKQRRDLMSQSDVEEKTEKGTNSVADQLSKLTNAPALQGDDKQELKGKAQTMAAEAAAMIRKMLESIRNMFSQNKQAKNAGAEMGPAASPAIPRPGM